MIFGHHFILVQLHKREGICHCFIVKIKLKFIQIWISYVIIKIAIKDLEVSQV